MGFSGDNILTWLVVNSAIMDELENVKKRTKKSHHHDKYTECDVNQLDEQAIQYEAQKLLSEIRAEIRYAESCLDFGDYYMQFDYWNLSDSVVEEGRIYEKNACARRGLLPDLKQETNENARELSVSSASSERSGDGGRRTNSSVQSWALSLENLLADPVGLQCFQEFLKKEFSEENLLFWLACERFKKMKDIAQMRIMAHEISRNYLSGNAAFLVNVDSTAVKKTESELNTPHAGTFDVPQQQVFQLMKFDSYNRFLKSTLYQDCLVAEQTGRLIPYEDEMVDDELEKNAWDGSQSNSNVVRVILPDGTSTFINGVAGQTLREGLKELEEHKKLQLQTLDVTVGYDRKITNIDRDIASLQENVVYLERRVLLRFDLPNGRSVGVKTNPNKTLGDVLRPVMKTNGYELNNYSIFLVNTKIPLSLDLCVSLVEDQRLVTKLNHRKLDKHNSDNPAAACRMGAQGFRASFRKFRTSSYSYGETKEDRFDSCRVPRKKSDDGAAALMSVLQKSQNSRLDDQRGLITRDIEMPDFLKVTSTTPAPVRTKTVNTTSNNNVSQSTPVNTHQDVGSSLIADLKIRDESEKLDISQSSPLNSKGRPNLCGARSCKELSSLDRQLLDRSYTFDNSSSMDRTRTSADSIDTLSLPTNTKAGLLFSKSDSSLLLQDSLTNISRSSNYSPEHSQKCIWSQDDKTTPHNGTVDVNTFICKKKNFSYDDDYRIGKEKNENKIRPQPISNFSSSDILRGLNDDNIIMSTPEKNKRDTHERNAEIRQDSGIDTNPSNSYNNLNNINANNESKDESATKGSPGKFSLDIHAVHKTQSSERIGSIDIIDYDLSPRQMERCKTISHDIILNDVNRENVFEENVEEGATLRGRQNEKITFV